MVYGLWFKEILGNIAIILLLSFKKFRPLGLIITLATASHLWFLYKTTSANPLTWFEKGYILVGISILAQFIAIIAAFIGLLFWWKLRKTQK